MEMDIAICQNLIAQSDVFSMTADRSQLAAIILAFKTQEKH